LLSDKPAKRSMTIAHHLLIALVATAPAFASAQEDPLKSPACGEAVARLQAARADGDRAATAVESLRAAAAQACLGSRTPPKRPSRVLRAPVVVPPPQLEVPARVAPLPPLAPLPPPVAIERTPQPSLCDAGGCWSSDGSHLQLVPPGLPGPRGPCIAQGAVVYCP
jgi:hypothetical protein